MTEEKEVKNEGGPPPRGPVNYVETPARVEIRELMRRVGDLMLARAEEHRRHGRPDRARKITNHATYEYGRIELIEKDWESFDEEERSQGREPY